MDKPLCQDCNSRPVHCKGRCSRCYQQAFKNGIVGKQDHKTNYPTGKRKKAVTSDKPEWIGDLEDDCTLEDGHFFAHAECMGEGVYTDGDGDSCDWQLWYVAVYKRGPHPHDEEALFHSDAVGGHCYPSGFRAREMAEYLIKLFKQIEALRAGS